MTATRSHRKGDRKISRSGEIIHKTGLWTLNADATSSNGDLSKNIKDFLQQLPLDKVDILALPGIQSAKIAIYVADEADQDGGGNCSFVLDAECLSYLSRLKVPIVFDVYISPE